jgi:hypothetical protein
MRLSPKTDRPEGCYQAKEELIMKLIQPVLSLFLSACFVLVTDPVPLVAQGGQPGAPQLTPATPVQAAQPRSEQLQQLVAPIALYPDALVAQILAAATYPDQVVEAEVAAATFQSQRRCTRQRSR